MLIEIIIILMLFLISGFFSMAEMAVVSSHKARLRQNASDGDAGAKVALELADNPNQLLSAVQIGMSLVSILTGAFGGATIADELSVYLKEISFLAPFSNGLSLAVVVLLIAFFNLVLGELVPKRIALSNPERIASFVASPLRIFSRTISPLVAMLSGSTDLVLSVLGVKTYVEPSITEEEIRILIDQGTNAGVIKEEEQDIMERVFSLGTGRSTP